MPTNLRSLPLEGYIADSAGNVLRNTNVIIKENTPSGSNIIDTVKSDDDGYFISKPIKNGVYDIYESGIRVFRQYHSSQPTVLQCYCPGENNIPIATLFSEYTSAVDTTYDINMFRKYIQIEPNDIDTTLYGHMFPLWNIAPYSSNLADHSFEHIVSVHPELTVENVSKFTHTRFDVEFFLPLYAQGTTHRRMRWAGIPGLIFYNDSKIVLPLDYYSLVPNHFYNIINDTLAFTKYSSKIIEITLSSSQYSSLSTGDVLEVSFNGTSSKFWCILYYKDSSSGYKAYGRMWNSSYVSDPKDMDQLTSLGAEDEVNKIVAYQGFYNGIDSVTQSTSEYFTVSENLIAQDLLVEMFNYNGAI